MTPPPLLSIGIDIGGTKVAAGVVDERRRRSSSGCRSRRPRTARRPSRTPSSTRSSELRPPAPGRVGRHRRGRLGRQRPGGGPVLPAPGLASRAAKAGCTERIDLPLIVDNDANAAAWAEYRFGAGRGSSVMVCITLGTGIGGGLVINGQLFRGTYGMAGEWGHMISVPGGHRCECGNRGCWEQYASGNALVREARELARTNSPMAYRLLEMVGGDPDNITGPSVTAAAIQGEPTRSSCWPTSATWLGPRDRQPRRRAGPGPGRDRRRSERRGRSAAAAGPAGLQPDADRARLPRGGPAGAGALPQRRRADRCRGPGPARHDRAAGLGPVRLLAASPQESASPRRRAP